MYEISTPTIFINEFVIFVPKLLLFDLNFSENRKRDFLYPALLHSLDAYWKYSSNEEGSEQSQTQEWLILYTNHKLLNNENG